MSTETRREQQIVDELATRLIVDGPELDRLRTELARRAEADDLLDVAYRTVDSPIGTLLVATSAAGLVRIAFEREDFGAVLVALAATISPRILRSDRGTDAVARQLDEYFAGRRRRFDVPLDLQLVHGFRRRVISHLSEIAYGSTESYATVATAAGSPAAVRAVGTACAHNPIPVVVPCHRVIRSDGSLGQYLGGAETKAALLALESVA
jgi:methylated-DNA-[protein]-cysteine S-methyltransferase